MPDNIVQFAVPKRPRIKQKDAPPDQRKVSVLPIRAITDRAITDNMFRVLAVLCSYCNRAGLTWVSQKRLSEDMKVSQQAISKQLTKLVKAGYLEIVRKGFRGERPNTVRVIFDPTVDTATAIAVTSPIEDTRPPAIRKEQDRLEQQDIDRVGQARIAKLIAQGLKSHQPRKEPPMAHKEDSRLVRSMKAEIAKKTAKKSPAYTTPEVVHEGVSKVVNEASHSQPNRVVRNPEILVQTTCIQVLKEPFYTSLNSSNLNSVLNNSEVDELIADGMTADEVADSLATLLPLYAAEGIEPTASVLMVGVRQLRADAR